MSVAMRSSLAFLSFVWLTLLPARETSSFFAARAHAQSEELTVEARARCIQSSVRVEVDTPSGTISGSGTMIDPRGYVLTNFHVVGHLDHQSGSPGVHHGPRFRIAIVRSERTFVSDEYIGEVVRGHVQLDLAILRIVARADGAPLETNFTAMDVGRELPPLGTRVWALGFPAGVRTINVTAGQIAGFENNTAGEASWMRTDTEFNPGNSGGALIDRTCRLVGVPTAVSRVGIEPIELARPAQRIPATWLAALATGAELTSEPSEGLRQISVLTNITDSESGDTSGRASETRYYRLPSTRPGVVSVSPRLFIGAIGSGGRIIRVAPGQVLITASDGPNTLVGVVVPRGRDGRAPTVQLRFTPMREERLGPLPSASIAALAGHVSRADGSACSTYVALAPRALDAAARVTALRTGVISESAFRSDLIALQSLASDGSFALGAAPGTYTFLVLGPAGLEETRTIEMTESGVDLGEIALARGCR